MGLDEPSFEVISITTTCVTHSAQHRSPNFFEDKIARSRLYVNEPMPPSHLCIKGLVAEDGGYYILDLSPCSSGPLLRVSNEYVRITPTGQTVFCGSEAYPEFEIRIQIGAPVVRMDIAPFCAEMVLKEEMPPLLHIADMRPSDEEECEPEESAAVDRSLAGSVVVGYLTGETVEGSSERLEWRSREPTEPVHPGSEVRQRIAASLRSHQERV